MHVCLYIHTKSSKRALIDGEYNIALNCESDRDVGDDHHVDNIHVNGVHHVGNLHHLNYGHLINEMISTLTKIKFTLITKTYFKTLKAPVGTRFRVHMNYNFY